MNKAKEMLDKWRDERGFRTYKQLAEFLEVAPNTLDVWKQRKEIPEQNILRYTQKVKSLLSNMTSSLKKISIQREILSSSSDESKNKFKVSKKSDIQSMKQLISEAMEYLGLDDFEELAFLLNVNVPTIEKWINSEEIITDIVDAFYGLYTEKWVNDAPYKKKESGSNYFLSKIEEEMLKSFKMLDKSDQKRIYDEIKKLANEKLDLSHLDEE